MMKRNLLQNGLAFLICLFLFAGVSAQTQTKVLPLITSSNASYTLPTTIDGANITITKVNIEAWGGGGAGGYAYSTSAIIRATGGGGGGSYAETDFENPTPGETYNIVIGQGGHATGVKTTNPDIADGGTTTVTRNSDNELVIRAMGGKTVTGYMNTVGAAGGDAYQNYGINGLTAYSGGKGADACEGLAGAWSTSGGGGGAGGPYNMGGDGGTEEAFCIVCTYCTQYNVESAGAGVNNPGVSGNGGKGKLSRIVIGDGIGNLQGEAGKNYGGGGGGSISMASGAGDANGGEGAPGVVRITITYTTEDVEIADGETTTCSGAEFDVALDITPTAFTLDQLSSSNFVIENVSVMGLSIGGGTVTYNTLDEKWHLTGTVTNQTSNPLSCNYTVTVTSPNGVATATATIQVNVYGKLDGGVIAENQLVCHEMSIQQLTSVQDATGGSGNGSYKWIRWDELDVTDGVIGWGAEVWSDFIEGANAPTYLPTLQGTHFYARAFDDSECGIVYALGENNQNYLQVTTVDPLSFNESYSSEDTICSNESYSKDLDMSFLSPVTWTENLGYSDIDFNWNVYWQKSTDKGATWENLTGLVWETYHVNLTPSDFSDGDDIWYRAALKINDCDSVPSNAIYKIHVKEIPDYTGQFPDVNITLWYGACDTSIAALVPPVLTPTPASITRADAYDRLIPGEYVIDWNVIADDCDIPVVYHQNVKVEYPACGTLTEDYYITDVDGKEYKTIRIGCDCWFAENLITNADDASYYNDDDANESFGKLYTWQAAVGNNNEEHPTKLGTTFIQGLCPDGWAIPSVAQYNTMFAAAGGNTSAVMSDDESTWLPGYAGTNTSGFAAMGAGYYEGVQYQRQLGYTYFWTADLNPSNSTVAKVFELRCGCDAFTCKEKNKADKLSVRCVRVEPGDITPPSTCPSLGATTLKIDDPVANGYGYLSDGTFTISTPIVNYDASLIMEGWYKITIGTAAPEWFLGTVSASGLVATLQYSDLKDINDALYYDETVTITPVLTVTCTDPSGVDIEGVGKTFDATCPDYYYYGISYPAPDKIVVVAEVDNYTATAVDPDQIAWTITSNIASQPPYIFASVDNNTDTDPGPDHVAIIDGDYQVGEISMDIINTLFPGATSYTFVPSMVVTCNSTTKTVGGPVITFSLPDFSDCPVLASTPTFGLNSGQYTADIPYTGTDAFEVHGFYALSRNYTDKYSLSILWYTINSTDKKLEIHIPTNADSYISSLASGETLRVVLNISYGPCPDQNVILEYTKP